MAKASFAETVETGLNFVEGFGIITEIESVVHQYPPNKETREQADPATMIRVMIQRTDKDLKPTSDDPVEEFFGVGSMEKFHPGIINGPEDDDVEDQGTELGASGNCLWTDGSKLNKKSKWGIFVDHPEHGLKARGYKVTELANGFLPNMVGLAGHFTSIALPKDADRTYKRDPKALVMDQIMVFPYEKGKKGGAGAAAGKAAESGKTAAKGAAAGKAASAGAGKGAAPSGDVEQIATAMLLHFAEKMPGDTLPTAKIQAKLFTPLGKGVSEAICDRLDIPKGPVPPAQHKEVQALFKNEEWLAEKCADLDLAFEDGAIKFPEAA